jgi:hypothetical protein
MLVDDMLEPALAMKEDKISNVRVTLMKVLQIMPLDIIDLPQCKPVLQNLVEEVETWESFGPEPASLVSNVARPNKADKKPRKSSSGPVDVDEVQHTGPVDVDDYVNTPSFEEEVEPEPAPLHISPPRPPPRAVEQEAVHPPNEEEMPEEDEDDTSYSVEDEPLENGDEEDRAGWKIVVFEDGPMGIQLEPTVDDRASRVYSFLDGPDTLSPARETGHIEVGDIIVAVNGVIVQSYDETVAILKAGGRREVTLRPGRSEDQYDDEFSDEDYSQGSHTDGSEEGSDEGSGSDESSKKDKKDKKEKKEKKEKKVRRQCKASWFRTLDYTLTPVTQEKKHKEKKDKKDKKEKKEKKDKKVRRQ